MDQVHVEAGAPLTLTLVWRAGAGATGQDLKVFTHLVSADGAIVAQHDAVPVAWSRPTGGWVIDEILVDVHSLVWQDPAFTGEARLKVGFYDSESGARVVWDDGSDALALPTTIVVEP